MTTATLTSSFAPLTTLDPHATLEDLEFVRALVGDARVVAIGESAHYTHEFYLLRHRLTRYLIERLGFTAIAFESGFSEAFVTDEWIGGGPGQLAHVQAAGLTYLFGECAEMGDMLSWLRGLNAGRPRPVRFYGVDLPASCGSLQPALRAVERYLADADPAQVRRFARLRELAGSYVTADPRCDAETRRALRAYGARPQPERDELTGLLADLTARFDAVELLPRADRRRSVRRGPPAPAGGPAARHLAAGQRDGGHGRAPVLRHQHPRRVDGADRGLDPRA